jgi:hypothetical protein
LQLHQAAAGIRQLALAPAPDVAGPTGPGDVSILTLVYLVLPAAAWLRLIPDDVWVLQLAWLPLITVHAMHCGTVSYSCFRTCGRLPCWCSSWAFLPCWCTRCSAKNLAVLGLAAG